MKSEALPPSTEHHKEYASCSMYDVIWKTSDVNQTELEINRNVTKSCDNGYQFDQKYYEITATSEVSKEKNMCFGV